jgi:hypothetical protein
MDRIRTIIRSSDFDEYYYSLNDELKNKYGYVLEIIRTQYVVSKKFVKHIETTNFYEIRVSLSSNEYRTMLVAIDADNFMEAKRVLLLNSFLKKDTKQYKREIKKAEEIFKRWRKEYVED